MSEEASTGRAEAALDCPVDAATGSETPAKSRPPLPRVLRRLRGRKGCCLTDSAATVTR